MLILYGGKRLQCVGHHLAGEVRPVVACHLAAAECEMGQLLRLLRRVGPVPRRGVEDVGDPALGERGPHVPCEPHGRAAGEQAEEEDAEGVGVGGGAQLAGGEELRVHVRHRVGGERAVHQHVGLQQAAQAGVGELAAAAGGGEQDVGRLEVAVDHAVVVEEDERGAHLGGDARALRPQQRLLIRISDKAVVKAAGGEVLVDERRRLRSGARAQERHHVGVPQLAQRLHLLLLRSGSGGRPCRRCRSRPGPA